jgi:aminoglycoside 6-adenylyltransferase
VLPMLQWHTKATHGWHTETWHGGRFIEQWAAPHLIADLGDSFARYDAADIARALLGQMAAFRTLATETARLLGYDYPHAADTYCSEWVKSQLQTPT